MVHIALHCLSFRCRALDLTFLGMVRIALTSDLHAPLCSVMSCDVADLDGQGETCTHANHAASFRAAQRSCNPYRR